MSRLDKKCPYTHEQLLAAACELNGRATLQMELTPEREDQPAEYKMAENHSDYTLSVTKSSETSLLILDDLVMRMASVARLRVAPHSLISSSDGEVLHVVDNTVRGKRRVRLAMVNIKDLLSATDGVHSCEQLVEAITKHSTTPKLDCVTLFEMLYFNWFVGGTDFGVERLRMVTSADGYTSLAPITQISSSMLFSSEQVEEYQIAINGKVRDITADDFIASMLACGLERKVAETLISKFNTFIDPWCDLIEASKLSEERAEKFKFILFLKS